MTRSSGAANNGIKTFFNAEAAEGTRRDAERLQLLTESRVSVRQAICAAGGNISGIAVQRSGAATKKGAPI